MNKNTNTQTDTKTIHMSLPTAHFFPNFFRAGKYLLPLLAGLFILAACGGGAAAPTTVEPTEDPCVANPFSTGCDTPEDETARVIKIIECIIGDAVGTDTCKDAVAANPCLTDPLASTCTADTVDETFVEYLEPAKDARAEFCRQGNNINNAALCGNAVTSLCPANPFDTVCFADVTYRDMRVVACSGATPPADSATVCRRSEITNIVCVATGVSAAPFNTTICGANDGVMNAVARQEFCRTNLSDNRCTTTISTFCATITAGNFANALCGTSASAALRGAYCVGLEAGNRPGACGNDTEENSLVRAYCTSGSAAALLDTNNNCATSLAKACETAPFGHACTSDDNIRARAVMCRNNQQGDNSCDTTITAICAGKTDGGNAIPATPLDTLCAGGTYDEVRQTACDGQNVTTPNGDCAPVIRSLCTEEPFNNAAGEGTTKFDCAGSATYDNARNDRNTFCRGDPTHGTCTRAVIARCGTTIAPTLSTIFDDLCNVGYDDARTSECANAPAPTVRALPSPKCGSETTAGYLFDYCQEEAGDTNDTHCPIKFAGAVKVTESAWRAGARDATDTNDLTPIPAGGAGTVDPISNFIVAGEDSLDLGANATRIILTDTAKLSDFDGNEDDKSGFSINFATVAGVNKYYAGLWSGTNLGSPITNNTFDGSWAGKMKVLIAGVASETDFTLIVNFADKTIKTHPGVYADLGNFGFEIDGKFTANGVIYGRVLRVTEFTGGGFLSDTSRPGILTGLIARNGAVGIFRSGDVPGGQGYVGGFVARRGGCTDHPFNAECTSDADFDARAIACRGDIDINGAGGCDATARVICIDGRTGPNPITANILDPLCQAVSAVDDQLVVACNGAPDSEGVYAFCPARLASLCPPTGPRNPECIEPTRTGNADYALWQWNAVKADKTTPLGILPEITKGDPSVSYVETEKGAVLNRGFLLDSSGFVVRPEVTPRPANRVASFANLGVTDGIITQSGVTLYRVTFDEFEGTSKIRHYAGLWFGTDLGAPLRADTNTKTTWNAFATLYLGNLIQGDNQDFTLEVNFANKTIKSIDKTTGQNPISITHGVADRGHLTIDGKFTELGVIYGSTEFAWATDEGQVDLNGGVSTGSLTGLVGEYGAVGAFISDGDATAGTYVGGFVALNPNACDATPFSAFCTSTTFYTVKRLNLCLADEGVDNFVGCPAFVAELCPISGARHEACPAQEVTEGEVNFIRWKQDATDATNTNKLTILDKLTGTVDPEFSYVEGRADGLERGNDYLTTEQKSAGLFIGRGPFDDYHQTLRLSDLAGSEDTASGVAFRETLIRDNRNQPFDRQYYAGLLSGTNLGAPISASTDLGTLVSAGNPMIAIWAAKLEVTDLSILFKADFKLEVNFGDKTIKTREDVNDPAVPLATSRTSIVLDSFNIKGTFTDTGVIYGTTELKRTRGVTQLTSEGTLTGLIGERGAVGVFFANDTTKDDAGTYSGGFVAVPRYCEFYPFDVQCTKDEDIMKRLMMCNEDININGPGGCNATFDIVCRDGNIGIGNGAIVGNKDDPLCVGHVRTGNADTALWKRDAVDTDGTLPLTPTTPLTILTEVGAHDGDANYVQAGADELNRGFLVDENDNLIGNPGRIGGSTLDLSDVGLADDAASGVKHERYVGALSNPFISRTNRRFYVGILSGTDLGARLTVDNTAEMIWNAKLVMVDEDGFAYSNDFTLEVNFGDKTINTTNPIAVASGSSTTGTLVLTGKFTPAGVIYGTSQLKLTSTRHRTSTTDEFTSDGSLTGLIGEKGAVGAFISKGALNSVGLYPGTAGRYAGGFVARNNSLCLSDTDTLFDTNCYKSLAIINARADMCEMDMGVNGVDGCNDTVMDICSDTDGSGSAINPFHGACGTDDTYDVSRSLSCANNRNGYGDNCMTRTTRVCETENKLLDAICTDGKYTERREALCAGDSIETSLMITGCEPIITDLCNAKPFNAEVGGFAVKFDCTASGNYDAARQARITLCSNEANNGHSLCDQPGVMAITTLCADDPFDTKCDDYAVQYETAQMNRLELCRGDAAMRGATLCANAAVRICDATDSPFATICGANDGISNAEQRLAFCKDNVADGNCPLTITTFCSKALGADLFLDICYTEATATAFTDNRVAACQVTKNTEVHADCPTVLSTNCMGNPPFSSACVTAGTLPTSVWLYKAQNADGGRLEILDEVGLDDAYTSYVQGNATGLNLGVLLKEDGNLKEGVYGRETVLSITDLDNVDEGDAVGGMAFTTIAYNQFSIKSASQRRYFAGLLNNVDLGTTFAPLEPGAPTTTAIWNARFYAVVGTTSHHADTTLIINFNDSSLKTRDDDAPVVLSGGAGNIIIDADFTSAGVIFGTSRWTSALGTKSSEGSVTGLIGTKGAIGAFLSSGENTNSEYAGGFVAAPVDCTQQTGDPFYRLCDASIDEVMMAQKAVCDADLVNAFDPKCAPYATEIQKTMFAETCRMEPLTTGCDRVIVDSPRLTINDCTDSDTGNPYKAECGVDFGDIFAAERTARTLSCKGNDVYNASQCSEVLGNCFDSVSDTGCDTVIKLACDTNLDGRCGAQVPMICGDDPLSIVCETGYEAERQAECSGQDIDALSEQRCLPVINALCEPDPFATAAGPVGNTFDCTVGDTYLGARQSACAGQDIAAPNDGRCVSILSTLCAANPFNNAAGVGAMTIDCTVGETYKTQRDTACMADPVAYGDGCDALKVPICEATPLNEICREDERYAVEREKECDGDENASKGTTCNLIIRYRCGQEPFNPSAGAGAVKFPCTQAGTVIDPDVRKIAIARIALCEDPENSEDPLCLVPTTLEFITTCANDPWNSICTNERIRSAYDDDRANRERECRADVNRSGCNNTTVRGALCVADGTPFAPFCGANDVAGRVDFCNDIIDNSKPEDPRCDIVTAEFCSTATGADLFNVVCDADYTQRQVAACRADTTADPDGGCDDLITNNCPVDSTKPECAIATAAVWNDYAVNSDSTARLTVLDEVGADDPDFNYVKAGEDGLNLGFVINNEGTIKEGVSVEQKVLKSYDGGTYEDTTSGVAFARISSVDLSTGTQIYRDKYYAGILSGTNLGGPVTDTTGTDITWPGIISVLLDDRYYSSANNQYPSTDGNTYVRSNFGLNINFATQTFSASQNMGVVDVGIGGIFTLNGSFNNAGVIYGTSQLTKIPFELTAPGRTLERFVAGGKVFWRVINEFSTNTTAQGTRTSTGTLTGLIGAQGAVGVFVSDGADNTAGSYAGGFVVDNDKNSPDCSVNPFDFGLCRDSAAERANLCINRGETPLPGDIVESDCNTPELLVLICASPKGSLDTLCTADRYDTIRQLECSRRGVQNVDNPEEPLCADVVQKLCESDPFNPRAGAGTNKLDCLNASSPQYINARKARITHCLANSNDPLCTQGDIVSALATCADNPLAESCTQDGVRAALTVCIENPDDPVCTQAGVPAILARCTANPSDPFCTQGGFSAIVIACEKNPNLGICKQGDFLGALATCTDNPLDDACTQDGVRAVVAACKANPSDDACMEAGVVAVRSKCASNPSVPICTQGVSAIVRACADNPNSTICTQGDIRASLESCATNPLATACTEDGIAAVVAACMDGALDPICTQGDIRAALAICADNPTSDACTQNGVRAVFVACTYNAQGAVCGNSSIRDNLDNCATDSSAPACMQGVAAIVSACAGRTDGAICSQTTMIDNLKTCKSAPYGTACVTNGVNKFVTACGANEDDPICTKPGLAEVLTSCKRGSNTLSCTRGVIAAVVNACANNRNDAVCKKGGVSEVLATCRADSSDPFCTQGGFSEIVSACADNPTAPICTQGNFIEALATCVDDPTADTCTQNGVRAVLAACKENPTDPTCRQADVRDALNVCRADPTAVLCTRGVSAIVSACASDPTAALCMPRGVRAVLATCDADPLDAVCTGDIADQYTQARETRLETCRGKPSTRAGVKCDNALPTICAEGDTPFAKACKGYDETQATIVQTCATPATSAAPICDTVVLPVSDADDVLVKDCIKNPYTKGCPNAVFYSTRAAICESVETSFTAGCLSDRDFVSANGNDARPEKARLIKRCADPDSEDRKDCDTIDAAGTRAMLIVRCTSTNPVLDKTGCDMDIGNGTTLAKCIENPFLADCSGTTTLAQCLHDGQRDCSAEVIAAALAASPDAVMKRDALVARCSDSGLDRTDCETPVGTLTLAGCAMDKANLACSGGVFDAYIVSDCTQAANVFKPRCQGGIDEAVITARAELALSCDVTAGGTAGGTGCDTIVSGSLTVDNCNTDPFATGCEDAAFANIRRVKCKEGSSDDACSVKDGQGYTSYVQGGASELDLGDSIYKDEDDLATYVKDDPKTKNINESAALDTDGNRIIDNSATVRDESRIYTGTAFDANARVEREGIVKGGLTLNDLVDATGNETSGFAFAYIPGGRGADDINGWDRYYAGLLSGTDLASLGGALTADATWNGKIAIVNGLNGSILTEQANFVLNINFANKTLTSGEVALPKLNGFFAINGKFTDTTGVIYGATRLREVSEADRSSLRDVSSELSSIGSLTGLIGANGAVGAFVSSGAGARVNTLGEYAGGFVAHKDAPDIRFDCTNSSNHLKADCIEDDAQYYNICVTTAAINGPAAQDFCAPFVARYIARELACVGETDLNNLTNPLCAPVFAQLCEFNSGNIFNTAAGTGTTKFDCMSITEYTATRTRICRTPAYAEGGVLVERDGTEYKTEAITACVGEDGMSGMIASLCGDDPFTQTVKTVLFPPTNLCDSNYDDDRKTVCMGEVSRDSVAPQRCFDTIEEVCADDPFDENFCYANNFDYRTTRLLACFDNMTAGGVVDMVDACITVLSDNCPTNGDPRNAECPNLAFNAWAEDFNTDDSDAAVASIPDGETKTARILLGGADGLDTETNVTSIHAPQTVFRLSTSKYKRVDTGKVQTIKELNKSGQLVDVEVPVYEFTSELNQDYNSGFAVFSANTTNSDTIGHYAGILSGTDVGAPITDPAVDTTWAADIAWVSDDGAHVKWAYEFTLNVNFVDGSISTPTGTPTKKPKRITDDLAYVTGHANTDRLSLFARWKANGILIGTTTLETDSKGISVGTLTGVIGNRGAVGVFASDDGKPLTGEDGQPAANPFAYAGGFVAKPTTAPMVFEIPEAVVPTAATWVASFDRDACCNIPGRRNRFDDRLLTAGHFVKTRVNRSFFITGRENGLGLDPVTGNAADQVHNVDGVSEIVLRLDDTIGSDGYTSGVALFFEDIVNNAGDRVITDNNQRQYYAGLLSGTTVGKNLLYRTTYTVGEESVASAIWGGVISGRFGAHSTTDLGGEIPNHTKGVTGITIDDADILNDLGQVVRKRTFFVTDRNFQLEINFEFSTIKTPAGARTGAFHSVDLRFDGRFDRNGIMSGTVDVAPQIKPGGDIPDGSTNRNNHGPGRFTGIIGETAAIGVFKADRGSTGTGNAGYVGGFIASACGFDLSNPTCLKDDVAVTTAYCTNLTANKGTNPFNVGCNDEVGIESIRANACVKNEDVDTAEVSRCPDLIVGFCLDATSDTGSNPFNKVCARFEGVQPHTANLTIARNNACLNFGAEADVLCRGRPIIQTSCKEADPYAYVGCNTAAHINDGHRRAYCMTAEGLANPACPNANSGKWLASFTGGDELTINPNTTAPTNEFLQIEGSAISRAGTTEMMDGTGDEPTPTTLDFSEVSYADVSLSADDGFAYFSGHQATMLYHYAGIFSTTDLGLPIAINTTPSLIWDGMLSINGANKEFTLTVVFDDADGMDDTVKGFIVDAINTSDFLIDGTFDAKGVITGTTNFAQYTGDVVSGEIIDTAQSGILSGLIGVDGAVAVFISDATGDVGYAGGFIATPSVAICLSNIFDETCVFNESIPAIMAFCTNITDNAGANPFNAECIETTHGEVGAAERDSCLRHAIFPDDMVCQNSKTVKAACELAPFTHEGCGARNDYDAIVGVFCAINTGITTAQCPNATSGDWVASFTSDKELNTAPDTTDATNEFLQIEGNTISIAGTTVEENGMGGDPTPTTLDFGEFSYGGLSLSANDGLAYFNGYQGSTLHYYAGIFGSTDLGVPIDADIDVTWSGMLSINGTDATFDLDVVFNSAGGVDNTVKGFITNPINANPNDLLIAGTFDANGVITGKVHFADFTGDMETEIANDDANGSLSGLISTQGAIAVFISKATDGAGYAGGFIATHSVDTCKADVFDTACPVHTSIPAITAFCTNATDNMGENPFKTECSQASDAGAVETAQRDACLGFATFPDESCQTLGLVKTACLGDPFTNDGCAARNDYDAIVGVFCATDKGIATANCPNATSGDWVASLPNLNTDPATAPDSTPTNEFLQIEGNTISTAGTTEMMDGTGDEPTPTTLDFSAFSYGGVSFGADDGLAYFRGHQNNMLYHYAGIFGSTDLGAPITINTEPGTTWDGMLSINGVSKGFTLAVIFNGSANTVDGFVVDAIDTKDFLIDGTFDEKGVITGKVHFDVFADETTPATPGTFNGELSGLIGVDGAVAVFISTATGDVGYAGGFVATPLVATCKADVFDTACPVHTSIPAITAFCTNITDNAGTNPFNANCSQASDSNAVETAQRDLCLADATFPHVDCQTLGLVKTACAADPFTNAVCATRNDYATILAAYCATPAGFANPTECPNANSGRWVASRTDLNTDPATATDSTPKNEFLQIAEKTISTTGTTKEANVDGVAPDLRTLNLSELHASFSADDGLAYFSGYQGDDLYHYAGIFGTSDLGAPITEDSFSAGWTGMLSINGTSKGFTLTVAFSGSTGTVDGFVVDAIGTSDLLIDGDFTANGVITGTTNFAEYTGDVVGGEIIGTAQSGILSGLIGVDGAVAVFISTATGDAGYAGGFVAAPEPQLNFADWVDSFAVGFNNTQTLLDVGADATEFVADTTSFITLNDADKIILSNHATPIDPTILRLDSTASDGQKGYESGIAFWHGDAGAVGSQTSQYYAGLLVGTDLGAPLTDVDKNGTWTGTIAGITNGDVLTNTEIKFQITFNASLKNHVGTIRSIANEDNHVYVDDDTLGAVNVNAPNTGGDAFNNTFEFVGLFNAQGVIRGSVSHTNDGGDVSGFSNGTFNGLIGEVGAVGVFKSHDNQPYDFIGGFVANPPAE